MKEKYGFNHAHKANSHNLAPCHHPTSCKKQRMLRLRATGNYGQKIFNYLEDMRKSLLHQKDRVVETQRLCRLVLLPFCPEKISDLFSVLRGSGKYTRSYTQEHPGAVPLFGKHFWGICVCDTADYNTPCLSWVIDGLAGYLMFHSSEFSATNHRGVLLPKFSDINLQYAKFIMEPIFRNAKRRVVLVITEKTNTLHSLLYGF